VICSAALMIRACFISTLFFIYLFPAETAFKKYSLTTFPVVYYTGATGFSGGLGFVGTFREKELGKVRDSLTAFLVYTSRRQFITNFFPTLSLQGGVWGVKAQFSYKNYPTRVFPRAFSRDGNEAEVYIEKRGLVKTFLTHQLFSESFHLGPGVEYNHVIVEPSGDPSPFLKAKGVKESDERRGSLGYIAEWDSREHKFFPETGGFVQFVQLFYVFGSEEEDFFTRTSLDVRWFYSVWPDYIVALRGLIYTVSDGAPFYEYAKLSGRSMRSLKSGYFQDQKLVSSQIEFRLPITDSFRSVLFVESGFVTEDFQKTQMSDLHMAVGGGLRYLLNRRDKIFFRLDIGYSSTGVSTVFRILEAF